MAGGLALPAQPPQQEPVFRATTQLVEFTFTAVDRNGKPVTDLTKDELVVEDKGKRREIAFFRFEGRAEAPTPARKPPEGSFSNRVEVSGGPPRNLTAIVIDTLNTAPADAMWVKAQAMRFLRVAAPETRVAVYFLGRQIAVVHDFTDDMESLRKRLESSTLGLPPLTEVDMNSVIAEAEALLKMSEYNPILEQILRDRIEADMLANDAARGRRLEMTLSMLESLGRHLSGIPGRKNLVWIGGGISMLSITGAMGFGPKGNVKSYESEVTATAKRLAQQGVALYNVDAKGLTGNASFSSANSSSEMPMGGRRAYQRQQQAETITVDPLPAMNAMASVTGGRVIINTNDPMDAARRAAMDMQGAYSVGFYLPDDADGKWHGLKLKTTRPGVKLVHREGYYAETTASQPTVWTKEEWAKALMNPLGSSAVHLDGRCEVFSGEGGGEVGVVVEVEPKDLHFEQKADGVAAHLELGIGEKDATGIVGYQRFSGTLKLPPGTTQLPPPSDNRLERRWKPRANASSLRVIVRDLLTGQYGSLDMPLKSCAAGK